MGYVLVILKALMDTQKQEKGRIKKLSEKVTRGINKLFKKNIKKSRNRSEHTRKYFNGMLSWVPGARCRQGI